MSEQKKGIIPRFFTSVVLFVVGFIFGQKFLGDNTILDGIISGWLPEGMKVALLNFSSGSDVFSDYGYAFDKG